MKADSESLKSRSTKENRTYYKIQNFEYAADENL